MRVRTLSPCCADLSAGSRIPRSALGFRPRDEPPHGVMEIPRPGRLCRIGGPRSSRGIGRGTRVAQRIGHVCGSPEDLEEQGKLASRRFFLTRRRTAWTGGRRPDELRRMPTSMKSGRSTTRVSPRRAFRRSPSPPTPKGRRLQRRGRPAEHGPPVCRARNSRAPGEVAQRRGEGHRETGQPRHRPAVLEQSWRFLAQGSRPPWPAVRGPARACRVVDSRRTKAWKSGGSSAGMDWLIPWATSTGYRRATAWDPTRRARRRNPGGRAGYP